LEAALPLATSFSESHAEVAGWLDEMEAELKAQGSPGDTLDQVKKQYENLKVKTFIFHTRRKIDIMTVKKLFKLVKNIVKCILMFHLILCPLWRRGCLYGLRHQNRG
jgi:hypothetical protein